jgi:NADH-quinone oxidoreductase subunit E
VNRRKTAGKGNLIAILQEIQERDNYLSESALRDVSDKLGIPFIDVYSVATFFRAFSLKPRGKHVCTVCTGTACHVRGAPRILDKLEERLGVGSGETTSDGQYTLETVNCLGCCAIGPIVVKDGKYLGEMTLSKIDAVVDGYRPAARVAEPEELRKLAN